MKKIRSAYIAMLIITVLFFLIPLLLKIPFIACVVSWVMDGFKLAEYKSSYLEVLGGIAGSWLAITGAIYTQKKFDKENEVENNKKHNLYAKRICNNFLLPEIKRNDKIIKSDGTPNYYENLKKGNYFLLGADKGISIDKWEEIRKELLRTDAECAAVISGIYKYYEPLVSYRGTVKNMIDEYGLDFNCYEEDYKKAIDYICED